jgi:hypothetical protein
LLTLRHANGRGLILDHADLNKAAYLSLDSIAQGNSRVRDARLLNGSCADGDCQIYGGTLDRAYVGGRTVVAGSPLLCEETVVQCKAITGAAKLIHAHLGGIVEIFDAPTIAEVHLFDGVMVYGTPKLIGPWELGGFSRIHEGAWTRPPLYVPLEHTYITECVDGKLLIECRCRSREYWLRHGPNFGRRAGWSESQILETVNAVEHFNELAVRPVYER